MKKSSCFDLKSIIALLPGHIYWLDKNNIYQGCNELHAQSAGLSSASEIVGKRNIELPWMTDDKELADLTDQTNLEVMRTGHIKIIEEEANLRNGTRAVFLSHKIPLRDDDGNIVGILGTSLDITAHKIEEKNLKFRAEQAELAIENIVANMPGHVYWKDINGVYLGCNNRQARSLGLKYGDEVVGKTDIELPWKPEVARKFRENDIHIMKNGVTKIIEEVAQMDGKEVIVLSQKTPLKNKEGAIIGVLGISIDITDRKEAEAREKLAIAASVEANVEARAQAELCQAVRVLAGSIGHDLRSPIATVSLFAGAIQRHVPNLVEGYRLAKEADLPVPHYISNGQLGSLIDSSSVLQKVAIQMNDFVSVTLDTISRAVSRNLTPADLIKIKLYWCISNILERYPFTPEQKKLIHWDRSKDFEFMGNSLLFFRAIFNLIKNALEQIAINGKGEIFLSVEDEGDMNILRVRDTAGGASPAVVEQMFEGYFTTKQGGTGVGLASCKITMQSFGGDIVAHSKEGEYMEFVLSFPKIKMIVSEGSK